MSEWTSSWTSSDDAMNHEEPRLSASEHAFILKALGEGLRVDGRRAHELRPINIAFGADGVKGSVQVRLGGTKVLAVATAELVEPYADRPTEGLLQFFVELSAMASPAFEPGRPSEAAVELMRLLERALRKSQAVDVEGLCVVAAKHVWSVRVDVTVLDQCGNLPDAVTLAALAALKHLRLPAVRVDGSGDGASVQILPADQAERQPLAFHHTPVSVSLGFFSLDGGSVAHVVDPTDREELVTSGHLTVVINQHQEICAMHKPGGLPIDEGRLMECVQQAATVAPQMLLALEGVLQAHSKKLAEAAETLRRTGRKAAQYDGVEAGKAGLVVPSGEQQRQQVEEKQEDAPAAAGGEGGGANDDVLPASKKKKKKQKV